MFHFTLNQKQFARYEEVERQKLDLLAGIARHLLDGLTPAQVQAMQLEVRDLERDLRLSREELVAAIRSQSKPT